MEHIDSANKTLSPDEILGLILGRVFLPTTGAAQTADEAESSTGMTVRAYAKALEGA